MVDHRLRHLQFPLMVFLCCAFPAAIGLSIGPYTGKGPPGTYVEPLQAKFQDRVPQGDPWPVKIVTPVPYRLDPPVTKAAVVATPEKSTLPWDCETVRAVTKNLTPKQIKWLAQKVRLTDQQKAEARRCLEKR